MKRGGPSPSTRLKIGVIGFGKFGQFIAKTLVKNHDVVGMGRGDYSVVAREIGAYVPKFLFNASLPNPLFLRVARSASLV